MSDSLVITREQEEWCLVKTLVHNVAETQILKLY